MNGEDRQIRVPRERPVIRERGPRFEERPVVRELFANRQRIISDMVNLLNRNILPVLNRNILPVLNRNGIQLPDPEPAAETNESENSGLTREEIERFPTRIANDDMEEKCSICLDNFKRGDKLRRLPCLHEFHVNCIDRWLISNNECPIDKFCCN